MTAAGFVAIWEFRVAEPQRDAFEELYAPDGAWVALFRRHPGHVRTELLRDERYAGRYMTIDAWTSRADWEAFRKSFAAAFEALDASGERLTVKESLLGTFDVV